MQRSARLVPVTLALTAALTAVAGCGGASGAASSSPLPSPSLGPSATSVASGVATDPAQQTIALTVSQGKVTGQTGQVTVSLGTRLRITVTADVADQLQIRGYDLTQELSAGQPGSLEFVADKPGLFDVELEHAKLRLTRLQVS